MSSPTARVPTNRPRSIDPIVRALRTADKPLWAIPAILIGLTLGAPQQAAESLVFLWDSLLHLLPFLSLSVLVAAWSRAANVGQLVARVFAGRVGWVVPLAALFGAVSPFCSCGVVPVVAALLAAGTPLPSVMAFWLSSPLMDPEMFVLTVGELGMPFAVARLGSAVGVGLLAGYATWGLTRAGFLDRPLQRVQCACTDALDGATRLAFWREPARRRAFGQAVYKLGGYLVVWMSLAFLLESLMLAWIPAGAIASHLGSGWAAVPAAALAGVPAYLNGYAAIPTVAGLIDLGLPAGAGLAFMIAGGATSLPAAMAVHALVRTQVFVWYLVLALTGAMTAGFALTWIG